MNMQEHLSQPFKCPYCKHDQVEGDAVEIDGRRATQRVSCAKCDREWHDVYTLSAVVDDGGVTHEVDITTGT